MPKLTKKRQRKSRQLKRKYRRVRTSKMRGGTLESKVNTAVKLNNVVKEQTGTSVLGEGQKALNSTGINPKQAASVMSDTLQKSASNGKSFFNRVSSGFSSGLDMFSSRE